MQEKKALSSRGDALCREKKEKSTLLLEGEKRQDLAHENVNARRSGRGRENTLMIEGSALRRCQVVGEKSSSSQ